MRFFNSWNKKLNIFLLIICLFPFQSFSSISYQEPRIIPFIGMNVEYNLIVYTYGLPFPINVIWIVDWNQYNSSFPELFMSNLTVQSSYISLFSDIDKESAIIIENITSREVLSIDLGNSVVLKDLYSLYYSPDQKNYTPFYVNTTNIKINDSINIYNYTMAVLTTDRINVNDFGYRDVWVIQVNVTNLSYVEHNINLVYDSITGVLVGGRLYTHWFIEEQDIDTKFWVQIICKSTNALTRHVMFISINEFLVLAISLISIIPVCVKALRMKEIKGGL